MKKKSIEKIPYLGLPEVSRKKGVKYIGVTAYKNIAHERHLFLEVYRNDKARMKIPVVRIVLTKKDFGTCFPEDGSWTKAKCDGCQYSSLPVWYREGDMTYRPGKDPIRESILYDQKDLDRIKAFCDIKYLRDSSPWWRYVDRRQEYIASADREVRRRRKYERRSQALKERIAATPEFSEKAVLDYAERCLFPSRHNLYYRKGKTHADVACSACGGVSYARWRPADSYESQFETRITEPVEGFTGICPLCGAVGTFIPQGRAKHDRAMTRHLFFGQKYKETGMVFRYFDVRKEFVLDLICEDDRMRMTGAREIVSGLEIARAYFEPGKKIQTDYHKSDYLTGKDYWDDCNLYGMANITVGPAKILPETWENMKGTILQYSAMQEYQKAAGEMNAFDYAERYLQTPQIEMLVKMGLTGIVDELIRYHYGIVHDEHADRADRFLGIRKEHLKLLINHHGSVRMLDIMRMEHRRCQRWTDEQIKNLTELGPAYVSASLLEYMPVQKLLNHVARYAGCGYGTGCSDASTRLMSTAQLYGDYIEMRRQQGYDLTNTVYLYPRDLRAAHDQLVREAHQEEMDKRCREVAERFPDIRKQYRRLRKEFFYSDEVYQIRPARSAEEIVAEGRLLHHCVGGDNYLSHHNDGKRIILLLRLQEDPDTPYVTVEIDRDYRICQWYGAYDKKPDKENVQQWLEAYTTRLEYGNLPENPEQEDEGETAEQLIQIGA